jgi:hypothetical protein
MTTLRLLPVRDVDKFTTEPVLNAMLGPQPVEIDFSGYKIADRLWHTVYRNDIRDISW